MSISGYGVNKLILMQYKTEWKMADKIDFILRQTFYFQNSQQYYKAAYVWIRN